MPIYTFSQVHSYRVEAESEDEARELWFHDADAYHDEQLELELADVWGDEGEEAA